MAIDGVIFHLEAIESAKSVGRSVNGYPALATRHNEPASKYSGLRSRSPFMGLFCICFLQGVGGPIRFGACRFRHTGLWQFQQYSLNGPLAHFCFGAPVMGRMTFRVVVNGIQASVINRLNQTGN